MRPSQTMRLTRSKKAITPWISWVILVAFTIVLGGFVSIWMKERVIETVDNVKIRIFHSDDCERVGIDIREVVLKNTQTLNMKVINTYDVRVDQLAFTLYTTKSGIANSSTVNITIKPNENKTVELGTNQSIAILKITPVYFKLKGETDMIRVVCNEKTIEQNLTLSS